MRAAARTGTFHRADGTVPSVPVEGNDVIGRRSIAPACAFRRR